MKKLLLLSLLFSLSSCKVGLDALPANFAKEMCSCLFVVEQSQIYCFDYVGQEPPLTVQRFEVNAAEKTVTAKFLTIKRTARWMSERTGCQLED